MIESYPLHWPEGWKRTKPGVRERARFNSKQGSRWGSRPLTIADGIKRVMTALERMGYPDWQVIISTNMPVKGDGMPYSGRRDPDDPGAAVYWGDGEQKQCMAIDQYDRLADNLAAIAGTLESLRAIERWGGAAILERAFRGFTALPEPEGDHWTSILGLARDASEAEIIQRYRELAHIHHPDRGGDAEIFHTIQKAKEQALKELA